MIKKAFALPTILITGMAVNAFAVEDIHTIGLPANQPITSRPLLASPQLGAAVDQATADNTPFWSFKKPKLVQSNAASDFIEKKYAQPVPNLTGKTKA